MSGIPRSRRSRRDWAFDAGAFALAVSIGLVAYDEAQISGDASQDLLDLDFAVGAAACIAVWWRRRWPVGLALVVAAISSFSAMAAGAGAVALFGLAVRRSLVTVVPVSSVFVATAIAYTFIRPDDDVSAVWSIGFGVAITFGVVGWGMYVRARHEALRSLTERATRSESEQQARMEEARRGERLRIAREMHDVLGHRLSLLSLHAGALEFAGPDASEAQLASSRTVIRENAHQALEDLRAVVGLLREEDAASGIPEAPQPTLAELPRLLEESRRGGMDLETEPMPAFDEVPEASGRQAYRIVQEGLTNARRHAGGGAVGLRIAGRAGEGIEVELVNDIPSGTAADRDANPGSGLLGVAERAHLAGGRIEHGTTADGRFRLWAWLPWPR